MSFYFDEFERRKPPEPLVHSMWRELLYQFLATIALALGAWYLWWRWTASLNYEALWFAIPLVLAETFSYIGSIFFMADSTPKCNPSYHAASSKLSAKKAAWCVL